MTRSSRRMDAIAGRSKWSATDKKCEECNGNMVKIEANVYVCTKCGLRQHSELKRKFTFRKYPYKYTKYSQKIEKQWEGKTALTPTIYDKAKNSQLKDIEENKSNYIKPKMVDKKHIIFCDKCNNLMSISNEKGKLICEVCGFIKQKS